jgi:hypothetical protein
VCWLTSCCVLVSWRMNVVSVLMISLCDKGWHCVDMEGRCVLCWCGNAVVLWCHCVDVLVCYLYYRSMYFIGQKKKMLSHIEKKAKPHWISPYLGSNLVFSHLDKKNAKPHVFRILDPWPLPVWSWNSASKAIFETLKTFRKENRFFFV